MTAIGTGEPPEKLDKVPLQIQMTVAEGNLILAALAELPFKVSYSLIQKIKSQADVQIAALQSKPASTEANET